MALVQYSGGGGTAKKSTKVQWNKPAKPQTKTWAQQYYAQMQAKANRPQPQNYTPVQTWSQQVQQQQSNYAKQYSNNWAYPQMYQNSPDRINQAWAQRYAQQAQRYSQAQARNVAPTMQEAMQKQTRNYNAYLEWITRQRQLRNDVSGKPRIRSDGYEYLMPGQGYVPEKRFSNSPDYGNQYANYGYGGYGGYGGYYGGSGGNAELPKWWLSLTTWRI